MKDFIATEAALPESFLFQKFNTNSRIMERVIRAKKTGTLVKPENIEEQILQIERTHVSILVDKVLDSFKDGNLQLIYSPKVNVPNAIPFIVTKSSSGQVTGNIFVATYGTMSENAEGKAFLNISMKDLYSLMEATYVAMCYSKNNRNIQSKMGLMKTSMYIYVSLISNLLNKEYALSMDPVVYDKVCFCLGKFFLERVWLCTNEEVIINYSSKANPFPSSRGASIQEITVLNDEYVNANILNISDLLNFMKDLSPRLSSLTVSYFMDAYIRMYKPPAVFALEVLPYFLFMVTSTLIGSYIVKSDIVGDMIKRVPGMNKYYSELVRAINY